MKHHGFLFLLLAATVVVAAPLSANEKPASQEEAAPQDIEEVKIRAAIEAYIQGTSYNDTELVMTAFYPEADLFLSHPEKELYILPIAEYLKFFADREKGVHNGREGTILSVDRANDIATAKAEIRSTRNDARYIDLFLLKKLSGEWKIISKSATRTH